MKQKCLVLGSPLENLLIYWTKNDAVSFFKRWIFAFVLVHGPADSCFLPVFCPWDGSLLSHPHPFSHSSWCRYLYSNGHNCFCLKLPHVQLIEELLFSFRLDVCRGLKPCSQKLLHNFTFYPTSTSRLLTATTTVTVLQLVLLPSASDPVQFWNTHLYRSCCRAVGVCMCTFVRVCVCVF